MRSLTIQVPEPLFVKLNLEVVNSLDTLLCTSLKDEFLICILAALGRNEPVLIFEEKE